MKWIGALIAVGLVALGAAPLVRAESDRAAARAFGLAAQQLYAAAAMQRPVVEARANRLTRDPVCAEALAHVPVEGGALEAAWALVLPYEAEALIVPILPALTDYVAALDRVRTSDSKLRSGRAALRAGVRAIRGLEAPPEDICAQLHAWEEAAYPAQAAPNIDDPAFDALFKLPQSLNKKIDRAVQRLRALGVPGRTAARFAADTDVLYKGWDIDDEVPVGVAGQ